MLKNIIDSVLPNIPQQPQTQSSTEDQLETLYAIANRLGLYDAADYLMKVRPEKKLNQARKLLESVTTCYLFEGWEPEEVDKARISNDPDHPVVVRDQIFKFLKENPE